MRLSGVFNQIHPTRILVMGDFILDSYTKGKAGRISPEAPVAIVHVQETIERAGGAGNTAMNLLSLGCEVSVLGRIGEDVSGSVLNCVLRERGVQTSGLITDQNVPTPVKNRVIAENQQVVRIDYEEVKALSPEKEQEVMDLLPELLKNVDLLAISDYGKGFLTPKVLRAAIHIAHEQKVKVIVDPKGLDFSRYKGADIIKPNLSEAIAASGLGREASLEEVANQIIRDAGCKDLIITRSEHGISRFSSDQERQDFPVHVREVKDVTGAGDTVLATLAWALASGLSISQAIRLSNLAAGLALEHLGCVHVTLSELAHESLKLDAENKVFEEEHMYALQAVLKGNPCTLLALHEEEEVSQGMFHAIHELSQQTEGDLLIYLRDRDPQEVFVSHLASLREVDFIILKSESLKKLCEGLHPTQTYIFENGRLSQLNAVDPLLTA